MRSPDHRSLVTDHCVFVYGTLMDPTRVRQLTGRRFPASPAMLHGYRKIVPAGGYPYVVADPDGSVDGMLLRNVDAEALRAFDAYEEEGRLYRRTEVVVAAEGHELPALTYVGISPRR